MNVGINLIISNPFSGLPEFYYYNSKWFARNQIPSLSNSQKDSCLESVKKEAFDKKTLVGNVISKAVKTESEDEGIITGIFTTKFRDYPIPDTHEMEFSEDKRADPNNLIRDFETNIPLIFSFVLEENALVFNAIKEQNYTPSECRFYLAYAELLCYRIFLKYPQFVSKTETHGMLGLIAFIIVAKLIEDCAVYLDDFLPLENKYVSREKRKHLEIWFLYLIEWDINLLMTENESLRIATFKEKLNKFVIADNIRQRAFEEINKQLYTIVKKETAASYDKIKSVLPLNALQFSL